MPQCRGDHGRVADQDIKGLLLGFAALIGRFPAGLVFRASRAWLMAWPGFRQFGGGPWHGLERFWAGFSIFGSVVLLPCY